MFDPFRAFDPIRRHKQRPNCSHLGDLIDDVVSVFEDMQNHYMQMMERHMSKIVDALTAAVGELTTTVSAHDKAVMDAVANLQKAKDAGDDAAVQAAIDAISGASSKLKDETGAIQAKMAEAAAAPVDEPAPAPAPDAAPAENNGGPNQ